MEKTSLELNEEELRGGVVVPLLRQLGFHPGTLRFERSFSIRLGHGVYTVDGDGARTARGRLDILCTANEKPICIVELKHPDVSITDEDRAQGISYARLTKQITPLVIITNGRETDLIDVFSGELVADMKNVSAAGLRAGIDDEIKLRYEALRVFVGLSYKNLLAFCSITNASVLDRFRADLHSAPAEKITKKYIPDAYVPRVIESQFKAFLAQSDYAVFPIIGESGVGKTATICHLVETHSHEPSIFLSGTILGESLEKEIADRFNLVFSAEATAVALFKKIASLSRQHSRSFIVFFDALDEWSAQSKASQISELAHVFRHLGIKLCISCNVSVWSEVITRRGVRTGLADAICPNIPPLADFSSAEAQNALALYKTSLNLQTVPGAIYSGAINPFAFRAACEVAYETGDAVALEADSRDVLRKFLKSKSAKSANSVSLHRTLTGICSVFAYKGVYSISESHLLDCLYFPVGASLPEELFTLGFLVRYSSDHTRSVAFYFGPIRDFVIAFEVLRLSACAEGDAATCLDNSVKERAVAYFLKTGNAAEKQKCLQLFIRSSDVDFVRLIAWYGSYFNLPKDGLPEIFPRLTKVLVRPDITENEAKQCLVALRFVCEGLELQEAATEWLELLAGDVGIWSNRLISCELAGIISSTSSNALRQRVLALCKDEGKDGYVRRYAIEAASTWNVDRASLFLDLIVDASADVRTWVRPWYNEIETQENRNALMGLLNSVQSRESLFKTLGASRLPDTGELLMQRFQSGIESGGNLYWLCRALGFLKHTPAVGPLCELLLGTEDRELRGHILLALGDIGDRDHAILALKKIVLESSDSVDIWWINHAFVALCNQDDEDFLMEVALSGVRPSCVVAIGILARRYTGKIESRFWQILPSMGLSASELAGALGNLFSGFLQSRQQGARSPLERYSEQAADVLRKFIKAGDDSSELAFWGLFMVHPNEDDLFNDIISLLPFLPGKISARRALVDDHPRLERLALRLCPWLVSALDKCSGNNPLASNLIELSRIFGDEHVIEALLRNRDKLTLVADEQRLASIENSIRLSNKRVRWLD